MPETTQPKNESEINAWREVVQGYYIWIATSRPTLDEILDKLEDDLNFVREEQIVLDAEKIISGK
jgi:hypothetical protein